MDYKTNGFSVRCICNETITDINSINTYKIWFYPNPAVDFIKILNIKYSATEIIIFDMKGNKILCNTKQDGKIDISSLRAGVYCLEIKNSNNVIKNKFIKR